MALLPPQSRLAARFVAAWLAANLARFLFWAGLVAIGFGLVIGVITYFLVRDEGSTCQVTAAIIAAIGTALFGGIAGGALAAVRSLAGWITDSGLGPMASKAIFAEALGVSDKRPEGTTDLAKSLRGATLGDAKGKLQEAFGEVFASRSLDRWLPPTGRWLASRVLNGAGWVATYLTLRQLPGDPNDKTPLDLLGLRDAIGGRIEQQAIGFVAFRARAFAWGVLCIGGVVTVALVTLVTWIASG